MKKHVQWQTIANVTTIQVQITQTSHFNQKFTTTAAMLIGKQMKVITQLTIIAITIAMLMQPKHQSTTLTIATKPMHVQLQSNWPLLGQKTFVNFIEFVISGLS